MCTSRLERLVNSCELVPDDRRKLWTDSVFSDFEKRAFALRSRLAKLRSGLKKQTSDKQKLKHHLDKFSIWLTEMERFVAEFAWNEKPRNLQDAWQRAQTLKEKMDSVESHEPLGRFVMENVKRVHDWFKLPVWSLAPSSNWGGGDPKPVAAFCPRTFWAKMLFSLGFFVQQFSASHPSPRNISR